MIDLETILVPTDFSEYSLLALPYARELARLQGAGVLLAHACAHRSEAERAHAALDRVAATFDPVPCRAVIKKEAPADFLVELAREAEKTLILMATHGRRGATRRLMGSTAEAVVARAACPVLTIKQPDLRFMEEGPEGCNSHSYAAGRSGSSTRR